MLPEINNKIRELGNISEEFKNSRDDYYAQRSGGVTDPITTEKIERLNRAIDIKQAEIEQLEIANQRPWLSEHTNNDYSKQFSDYLRKGIVPSTTSYSSTKQAYAAHSENYGSALVSPKVSDIVVRNNHISSPFRQLSTIEKISTSTLEIIIDVENFGNISSGWSLERTTAGGLSTTDATKVNTMRVDTYELYAQPTTTQKFLEDSSIDVEQWLADKVQYAFYQEENKVFLNGSGIDRPKGVLTYPFSTQSTETWGTINEIFTGISGEITVDSMISLYYALSEPFISSASLLMHRRTLEKVRMLKYNDQYLWQPSYISNGRETVMSIPVHCSEFMPIPAADARAVMLADFKRAFIIADRYSMQVMRDPYSYKPLIAFYTTERIGFSVMNTNAIKILNLGISSIQ